MISQTQYPRQIGFRSLVHSFNLLYKRICCSLKRLRSDSHSKEYQRNQEPGGITNPEKLFSRLFHTMPIGLVVLDGNGLIRVSNPIAEKQLGVFLVGRQWQDVMAEVFQPSFCQQSEIRLRNGGLLKILTSALDEEPGQLVLLVDVTSEQAIQENRFRKQHLQSIGNILGGLAHQIRTPLAAAMLYATQQFCEKDGLENREKICTSLKHIDRIVNGILTYTRSGSFPKKPVKVLTLVDELTTLTDPVLRASGCRMQVMVEDHEITILANHDALVSALQNLIINASQACGDCGEIRLRVHRSEPASVEFLISDNGSGITSEIQKHIFKPFYTNRVNGTGLGLAIVETVIEKHGAEIWVESIPGYGTTFGLRFPQYKQESAVIPLNHNNLNNGNKFDNETSVYSSH